MSAKYAPPTITSNYLQALSKLNTAFQALETALDKCLFLDGTGTNSMTSELDMNSNQIINLPTPTNSAHAASKGYVDTLLNTLTGLDAAAILAITTDIDTLQSEMDAAESDINDLEGDVAGLDATKLDIATANRTITIAASGGDFDDIQEAIDSIDSVSGYGKYSVTVQLQGHWSLSEQVLLRSAYNVPIYFVGTTPTQATFSSVIGVTSNGAGDHDVTIEATGHSWQVGDIIVIRGTTGTGEHGIFRGCYVIDAVNGNEITFNHKNKNGSWPTYTATDMDIRVMHSSITFTGADIRVDSNYTSIKDIDPGGLEAISGHWYIGNMALIDGTSDADAHGLVNAGTYNTTLFPYTTFGINGFKYGYRGVGPSRGIRCINLHVHGSTNDGISQQAGGVIYVSGCSATGCATGLRANDDCMGFFVASVAGGCTTNFSISGSRAIMSSCTSADPATYATYVTQGGQARIVTSTLTGTVRVNDGSKVIFEGSSTCTTLSVDEWGLIIGLASMTAGTETFSNCVVDGRQYLSNAKFVATGLNNLTLTDSTYTTVIFSRTELDPHSVYNSSTGIFTAPYDGYYLFNTVGYLDDSEGAGGDDFVIVIARFVLTGASAGNYRITTYDPAGAVEGDKVTVQGSDIFYMDAGDTCKVEVRQSSGENKVADRAAEFWRFSGFCISAA